MAIKATNQVTVIDVTDAYNIILTSEAYTFVGNTSGAPAGLKCATQAVAYCGSNQCSSVTVDSKSVTCPTGISATVENSGTSAPTITFTTTATITAACEAIIPVTVDGITINKRFSFAVAKAGSNGTNGKNGTSVTVLSTEVTYAPGSSGTTAPSTGWVSDPPAVSTGHFLWTKTVVNYSDGKSTTSYAVSYQGTNGSNGTSVKVTNNSVTYAVSSSGTTKPTSGWGTEVPTVNNGQYLWTKTYVKYSDGTETTSYAVSYKGTNGQNGKDGAAGKDAITVTITASNGTVFRNNSGSTVLTAHVFKGGVEQSITDAGVCGSLGSIKWYKIGSTTAIATSKTLTVSANDVDSSAAYTCNLEG